MSDTYKTADLGLAAYLLATGENLDSTEREPGGRRLTFCFSPSPTMAVRAKAFINGGVVEARTYFHAIKDLKVMAIEKEK